MIAKRNVSPRFSQGFKAKYTQPLNKLKKHTHTNNQFDKILDRF